MGFSSKSFPKNVLPPRNDVSNIISRLEVFRGGLKAGSNV